MAFLVFNILIFFNNLALLSQTYLGLGFLGCFPNRLNRSIQRYDSLVTHRLTPFN